MVSRLEITMFLWRGWWIGSPPLVGVIVGAVRVGVVRPVKSLEVLKSWKIPRTIDNVLMSPRVDTCNVIVFIFGERSDLSHIYSPNPSWTLLLLLIRHGHPRGRFRDTRSFPWHLITPLMPFIRHDGIVNCNQKRKTSKKTNQKLLKTSQWTSIGSYLPYLHLPHVKHK